MTHSTSFVNIVFKTTRLARSKLHWTTNHREKEGNGELKKDTREVDAYPIHKVNLRGMLILVFLTCIQILLVCVHMHCHRVIHSHYDVPIINCDDKNTRTLYVTLEAVTRGTGREDGGFARLLRSYGASEPAFQGERKAAGRQQPSSKLAA